ncbi:carbohydrate ABC transporter membrane protein 1, CUT1 family [Jatrophihabitans endophyticus]|uniref:Carbohydrate ABC transporter membrane protein 1, CUT1 family n=1 Tax=Jatrophihabitans endophyticus TaxID=1206085 RepID=A0A1M5DKU8_9ACTN|nr:sugar ABC transporter permease [Jatrophihabitans endophyticus]SHF67629.1 carbohydrate ABC transporter membrane protein 1, CUT1 family [Jatrophihabitans endophyticus]
MTATLDKTEAPPPAPESRHRRKEKLSDRARQERNLGWKLVAPAFVAMMIVVAYPILNALYLSLFNYRLTEPDSRTFVFLKNYGVILADTTWWKAVWISTLVMVVTVTIEFVLGMALAMVMNRIILPRRTLRTIVLIPYSIITVVSAYGFKYAFAPDTGFISQWLHDFTGWITFGGWHFDASYDWYGGHWSSLIAIMISEIWKTTPFMSLLLLAGLAQVPGELQEAAEVDGATFWERLVRVTLPSMKAAILVALLFRALDSFRIFDNIFIMTNGSQNTTSIAVLAYDQTITRSQIGLGSAVSILLFALVVLISTIFIKLFKTDLSRVGG